MGRSNGYINLFYISYFKIVTPRTLTKSKGTMKEYKLKGKAFYYVGVAIIIIPIVFLIMLYLGWIVL